MPGFHCHTCGEYHGEVPLAFGPDAPNAWFETPPGQLGDDSELASDQCVLHDARFFVRGCLDIPIQQADDVFRWLVWVEVSEDDFMTMSDQWEQEGRELQSPFSGRLDTILPFYPDTLAVPVRLQTQPVGERPRVIVDAPSHPLYREQIRGLAGDDVQERAGRLLH